MGGGVTARINIDGAPGTGHRRRQRHRSADSDALARRGAQVLCTTRNTEAAENTAAMCREAGGRKAAGYRLDVAGRAGMQALAAQVTAEHGDVDIVVNNAGVGMVGRFTDVTGDQWEWIRSINLDGVINGCAVFAPGMLARGRGHIVNVSSGLAYMYVRTQPAYITTKAAVLALSRCLRSDFGEHGVGVTAICPGVTNTPIVDKTPYLGDQDDEKVRARSQKLFRRGHQPAKVAAAIVRAIEHDRSVVPVGYEAWLGWWFDRYLPIHTHQAFGKLPLT